MEVEKVTGDVVKQACCKMKPGKIDVTEAYYSDVFLHAPDYLFELLAVIPHSWNSHSSNPQLCFPSTLQRWTEES
jgi:hypothetical protein